MVVEPSNPVADVFGGEGEEESELEEEMVSGIYRGVSSHMTFAQSDCHNPDAGL